MHRIKQYKKKMRRQAKKMKGNPMAYSIYLNTFIESKREVGIPNSFPFKEEILDEEKREKEQQKAERLERKKRLRGGNLMMDDNEEGTLEEVKTAKIIRPKEPQQRKKKLEEIKRSRKEYMTELNELIDQSDVILFTLDARIPADSRSKDTEEKCKSKGKGLVLVLNKTDLVPAQAVRKWIKKLSEEYPTTSFSSIVSDSDDLVKKIKKVNNTKGVKIGIIGYPNTGKKSLLGRLNNSSLEGIKLLNKTGTVLSKQEQSSLMITTVAELSDLGDPYMPVHALLKKIPKEELLLKYEISDYKTTQEFLENVSRSRGLLLKGGFPDHDSAARAVLADWMNGKIKYHQEC